MTSWCENLLRILFPPRCAACRTLLSRDEKYLCRLCAASYADAKERNCPRCLQPMHLCDCPSRFMEHKSLHVLIKLYRYRPQMRELPENKLIYRLKRANSAAVTDFLAAELAPGIRRHMKEGHDYVIVGAPRSKSAIRKYGYDHVEQLGKSLSRLLKIPYVPAVRRIGNTGQQKKKNRKERLEAAAVSYRARENVSLKGKVVILLDDVATTGATLTACAKELRAIGARTVICAVIGSSFHYSEIEERKIYETARKRLMFPYQFKR